MLSITPNIGTVIDLLGNFSFAASHIDWTQVFIVLIDALCGIELNIVGAPFM
jgi:hypothetical protein